MKRLGAGLMAAAMLMLCTAALAADKPQPKLTVDKVEAAVFDRLTVAKLSAQYGISETLSLDGKNLLMVKAVIYPEWTEKIDRADIRDKEIKLVTDAGEEILMIGYFERFGIFKLETKSFYKWRSSDWKDKKESVVYNAVFAVPQGVKTAEFKLGADTSAKITVPGQVQPMPDPAQTVKIDITSAAIVDQVRNTRRVGDIKPKPATSVTYPMGQILEVKVKVTPQMGNGDDPDHFFWYTPWLGVMTDKGQWVPTFGEMFMEGLSHGVSHNLGRGSDGKFSSGEATLYFAVPKGTKAFKLYYLSRPVAEGQV